MVADVSMSLAAVLAQGLLHPEGSSSLGSPISRGMGPPSTAGAAAAMVPEMPKATADRVRILVRKSVLMFPMTLCLGQNKYGKRKNSDVTCISAEEPKLAFDRVLRDICALPDSKLNWNALSVAYVQPGGNNGWVNDVWGRAKASVNTQLKTV